MTEHEYKSGAVKSLKLVNFMCHESFDITFGPRVNFVIGPNGSGKSALLTAIVVVLGGRATTTSRARRVNEFVMYGKKFARITCVIHNYSKVMDKDRAFKPEEYGKEIIIEKTLLTEDSSRLVMKDERGKKVSERKQELDDMLDHFNILINNPICILNQEISKTFLHSKRPEDKYDLFMKATNLETILENYNASSEMHRDWEKCNDTKAMGFRMLDSEKQNIKEKINFLHNRTKLSEMHAKLDIEFLWATFRDTEQAIEQSIQKIDTIQNDRDIKEAEIRKRDGKIKDAEFNIEQHKVDLQRCCSGVEELRKELDDNRMVETRLKSKRVDLRGKLENEQRNVDRLKRDKESLQKSIDEARKKYENTNNSDGESKAEELARIEEELKRDHAREQTLEHSTDQLYNSLNRCRSETISASTKVSDITNKISAIDATLRRLKGGQRDNLHKYGEFIKNLCSEIDRETKFRVKPRGPLGNFIKLKTPQVAGALELHLGRNASAFAVDNIQDLQTLNGIIRSLKQKFGPSVREPLVIARDFGRRHDVNRFKSHHDVYKTMLDHIEVGDEAVYNALVDRSSLESVLFIPDYKNAENLMINQAAIPANTRCAYTEDCFCMYPRTQTSGYKCIASNQKSMFLFSHSNSAQIALEEAEKSSLQSQLRDAENIKNAHSQILTEQKQRWEANKVELNKLRAICRQKEARAMELKTTVNEVRPQLLTDFETDLDKTTERIYQASHKVEELKEQITTIDKDLSTAKTRRDEVANRLADKEKALSVVKKKISDEKELIARHKDEILKIRSALAALETKEQELIKFRDEQEAEKNTMLGHLPAGGRPSVIRQTNVVVEERKDVERQLRADIDDNADPSETIKRLEARAREIAGLSELRKLNTDNFHHTAKSLAERHEGFKLLRLNTISNVSTTFASVIRCMGMNGELHINPVDVYHQGKIVKKAKTLEMSIDTAPQSQRPVAINGLAMVTENNNNNNNNDLLARRSSVHRSQPAMHLETDDDGPVGGPQAAKRARRCGGNGNGAAANEKENMQNARLTDTRSLSGGERSFSTVAFILSLWWHCSSPFKLMDEIDVFMDMVTRRLSYAAMIKFASSTSAPGQFIFLSPLELPRIEDTDNMVRIFEMPRIERKGVQSQQPGTSNGVAAIDS